MRGYRRISIAVAITIGTIMGGIPDAWGGTNGILPTGPGTGSISWSPTIGDRMAINGVLQGWGIHAIGVSQSTPKNQFCLCGAMSGTIAGMKFSASVRAKFNPKQGDLYPIINVYGVFAGSKFSGQSVLVKSIPFVERVWRITGNVGTQKISGTLLQKSVSNVYMTSSYFQGRVGSLVVSGTASFFYTGFKSKETIRSGASPK